MAAANLVEVAALVGDTARATMLAALMGGQSLTGTELAFLARVSRPTASEHLSRLVEARLLAVTRRRRFAYYRIASPLVAQVLESIKAVAAIEVPPRYQPRSARRGTTLRADLLRSSRRPRRRCDRRCAGSEGLHHSRRRRRRGNCGRRGLPHRIWRRLDAGIRQSKNFLPSVSRLERAALSCRWTRRR
jgi:DNA-binding transcriptional ArsR family regulator